MSWETLKSWPLGLLLACALIASAASIAASASAQGQAASGSPQGQALTQQCDESQYPATRDPSNPLMLPKAPGSNPLSGARFFIDGPKHGVAAGAIAKLLGVDPSTYAANYSWSRFEGEFDRGALHAKFAGQPLLVYDVHQLKKIAAQPEEQRFSYFSEGGGPRAVFGQVQKVFCRNLTADPGTVPIITTIFLYPSTGYCPSLSKILATEPTFKRQVDEMVAGIDRRPAVMLIELDAVGASGCLAPDALTAWESDLRYEVDQLAALPHTVVYVEGGYSDAATPAYTDKVLNAVDVSKIRGFFTNDTHLNWTINEIHWAQAVSALTGGAHFIVNTAQNGAGPLLNPHPGTQGIEDLCNPPGRGLGPPTNTSTGFTGADAFLWMGVPGNSTDSKCHTGDPPAGTWWAARAIGLASRANATLGPGFPSKPY